MAKPSKGHGGQPATATAPAPAAKPDDGAAAGSAAGSGADGKPEEDELAKIPHIAGPKLVDLGHGAEINVPAGMVLFERETAQKLLREGGNSVESTIAAVVKPGAKWLVVIDADDVGYVDDDDAKDLDADAMLKNFKDGTAEQNKDRVAKGVPELFVDGWSEPLHYDKATRHLVWGLNAHDNTSKSVNFFTRVLGRNGYLSVDLIDSADSIGTSKTEALAVLDGIHFKSGQRYEDHAKGDKDSGMGLTALVVAGTGLLIAKKTGLLIGLLVVLKKGVIVVVVAIGAFFKRLFGGKKKKDEAPLIGGAGPGQPPGQAPGQAPGFGQGFGNDHMPGSNAPVGYAPPSDFGQPGAPQGWPPAPGHNNPGQNGQPQGGDPNGWPQNGNGGNGGNNNNGGNNGGGGGGWPQG